MAPRKPILRTYGKANKSAVNSIDAFNKLLVKNITKRKLNKKIEIKQLPERHNTIFSNDSIDTTTNNTFDRLMKGPTFHDVKTKVSAKCVSLSRDSPIHTRSYKPKPTINATDSIKFNTDHTVDLSEKISILRFKEKTATSERINESLIFEEEHQNFKFIRSTSEAGLETPLMVDKTRLSLGKIFTSSIVESGTIHSSTPISTPCRRSIIKHPISPIKNDLERVIEKSFEEVKQWDTKLPKFVNKSTENFLGFTNEEQMCNCTYLLSSEIGQVKLNQFNSQKRNCKLDGSPGGVEVNPCSKQKLDPFVSEEYENDYSIKRSPNHFLKSQDSIKYFPQAVRKFSDNYYEGIKKHRQDQYEKKLFKYFQCKNLVVKLVKLPEELVTNGSVNLNNFFAKELIINLSDCLASEKEHYLNISMSQNVVVNLVHLESKCSSYHDSIEKENFIEKLTPKKQLAKNKTFKSLKVLGNDNIPANKTLNDTSIIYISDDNNSSHTSNNSTSYRNDVMVYKCLSNENNVSSVKFEKRVEIKKPDENDLNADVVFKAPLPKAPLHLKPGKFWRRSLLNQRRESWSQDGVLGRRGTSNRLSYNRQSTTIVSASNYNEEKSSFLDKLAKVGVSQVLEEEKRIDDSFSNCTRKSVERVSIEETIPVVSPESIILSLCGQTRILPFQRCYPERILNGCKKIGEGVYGEVFMYNGQDNRSTVMKVIPVEGSQIVNGDVQKKFEEVMSEVIITKELSNLRYKEENCTSLFTEMLNVCCVSGKYPKKLLELWENYDQLKGSENDSPEIFKDDQNYVVLELANAGKDLEAFVFNNAMQAFSVIQQVAFSLAVAEQELKFEHRDLHWGNVLISEVNKKEEITFSINRKEYKIKTKGVLATIIDFTLSRMQRDGVVMFNDLSQDSELFASEGDYQFDIYRLMQKKNGNDWHKFEPYSNVLWLHYILIKAVGTNGFRYRNAKSKEHQKYLNKIRGFRNKILNYNSVQEFIIAQL